MILTDTSSLVGLLDSDDPYHQAAIKFTKRHSATKLLTTWACFTEAMYLIGSVGGYRYQSALWHMIQLNQLTTA